MQDLFSEWQADVWLLLVPHERQIEIERDLRACRIAGKNRLEHFNQHLGIRESRHGARQRRVAIERIIERAVPEQREYLTRRTRFCSDSLRIVEILPSPGLSSCFKH
jgi:hypothetical protein